MAAAAMRLATTFVSTSRANLGISRLLVRDGADLGSAECSGVGTSCCADRVAARENGPSEEAAGPGADDPTEAASACLAQDRCGVPHRGADAVQAAAGRDVERAPVAPAEADVRDLLRHR